MHFFWGSFDLAVTRFSGRAAPPHPGTAPNHSLHNREMSQSATGADRDAVISRARSANAFMYGEQRPARAPRPFAQLSGQGPRLQLAIDRSDAIHIAVAVKRCHQRRPVTACPALLELPGNERGQFLNTSHLPVRDQRLQSPRERDSAAREEAVGVLQRCEQP